MNILVDRLPTELEVNGVVYKIDPDFRPCLRTILAFEDPDLAVVEKNLIFYDNLYIERPPDMAAALKMGQWFLNAGKEYEEDNGPRVFSWTQDADLIYAAFQQTHGVDLQAVDFLHWWRFLALFMDLGADTAFFSLVGLRRRVKTGKATKEEKAAAREMGNAFVVPEVDTRTIEERIAERAFMDLMGQGAGNG